MYFYVFILNFNILFNILFILFPDLISSACDAALETNTNRDPFNY